MKLKLKKDIIIPEGTILESWSGSINYFEYLNDDAIIALGCGGGIRIIVNSENKDYFEKIETVEK